MNRRSALGGLAASVAFPAFGLSLAPQSASAQLVSIAALPAITDPAHALQQSWAAWKLAYLTPEGRVIDTLQEGASHSESQGYGLFMAATFGDQASFDLIDTWTQQNLAIRPDNLFAWRWLPAGAAAVPDLNNASDGDLFYAWALVRAAKTFVRPELIGRAAAIAQDLAATCLLPHPDGSGRVLFTPASAGFARETGIVVNPSYYMPRAMRELAEATGIGIWAQAANDGETLMAEMAVQGLIPDWITVTASGFATDTVQKDHNGYEAMRVALFLIWSGSAMHPAVGRQAEAYQRNADPAAAPTIIDRLTLAVLEKSPDSGYRAIAGLVNCAASSDFGAAIPRFTTQQPYYPATLHMFTFLAQIEASPSCLPI